MARQDIAALLGRSSPSDEPSPPQSVETTPAVAPASEPQRSEPRASRPASPRESSSTKAKPPVVGESPLYMNFERKEARLRADQYAELTAHARRLNKTKGTGGERITENTLIRIAIDLLLPRLDQASGRDEGELRESVRSTLR